MNIACKNLCRYNRKRANICQQFIKILKKTAKFGTTSTRGGGGSPVEAQTGSATHSMVYGVLFLDLYTTSAYIFDGNVAISCSSSIVTSQFTIALMDF